MRYGTLYDTENKSKLAQAIIPQETRDLILQELNDQLSNQGVEFKSFTLTSFYYKNIDFIFKIGVRIPAENAPKDLTGTGSIKMFGEYVEEALARHNIEFDTFNEDYSGKELSGSLSKPEFAIAFDVKMSEEELEEKWEAYKAAPKKEKPKRVRKSPKPRTDFDDIKDYANELFGDGNVKFRQESEMELEIYPANKSSSGKRQLNKLKKWVDDNTLLNSFVDIDEDEGYPYLYIY